MTMWWYPSQHICQTSSVLINCWRSPLCWPLIFCKTYKFLCNIWCVMCYAWYVMFYTWFFVRSWLHGSRGDKKYPIWVTSELINDIQKFIPGGSRMYTISCKALYSEQCTLYTVNCTLSIVYWTLYIVNCILYTVYGSLYTVHCILYTVYCILYTVYCTLHTVHCILCTVYCTLYIVHCILYTESWGHHSSNVSQVTSSLALGLISRHSKTVLRDASGPLLCSRLQTHNP